MDIEAKHTEDKIAEWRYQDIPHKLWPIRPLSEFWGINRRTEKKLNKRGIFTIGDLANYPYQYLKRDSLTRLATSSINSFMTTFVSSYL